MVKNRYTANKKRRTKNRKIREETEEAPVQRHVANALQAAAGGARLRVPNARQPLNRALAA